MGIQLSEAIEIISTLSNESEDQNTKDALKLALVAINELKEKSDKKKNRPKEYGQPWSKEIEALVIKLFREKKSLAEIASFVERGRGAVMRKLVDLGEVESFRELKGR